MGIDLQWISERGEVRESVLDERNLVAEIVAASKEEESVCLRFIDPYGDTIFNQLQIPVFLKEVRAVAAKSLSREAMEHRGKITELATKAEGQVHTYLKFYGD